jgi:phospholipid/cholesterol/gamma-HCH transport system substrate-binding protein
VLAADPGRAVIKQTPSPARLVAMAAFALSCFGLLLFLWLTFGGSVPLAPQGYRVHVDFPEATTLANEADVRISGVTVGKVKSKNVKPSENVTDVVLEIDHQYAPIPKDSQAILRAKTLLGETYVELSPGSKQSGNVADGGTLAKSNVSPTVELDEIFRGFTPRTRLAFQQWMESQGRVFKGRGRDLNEALGNLAPFAEDTNTLVKILDEDRVDVRRLVRNTGSVFEALTERRGQLRQLVVNSNAVFETTAQRDQALQDTFRVLPTFLAESRKTLTRVSAFADNADPLVTQLRPFARELSPTLISLERLAPDLRGLFRDIDPLVDVSKKGLPATSDFFDQLRPLLDATDPFLRNLNPILQYAGLYKHEITAFFANDVASTQASSTGSDNKTQLHYLRTTNPLNPENLAVYPTRLSSNRSNPYLAPLGYNTLATKGHLQVFGSYLCTNNPVPSLAPASPLGALTQPVIDLVNQFAFAGGSVSSPPCDPQEPLGRTTLGQSGLYPHVEAASP